MWSIYILCGTKGIMKEDLFRVKAIALSRPIP